jgi:FAD-linked sulfhydryl oxidase
LPATDKNKYSKPFLMTVEVDAAEKKGNTGVKHGGEEGKSIYIDPVTGQKIPMKDGKPCRTCVDMKTWKRLGKAAAKIPESQKETNIDAKGASASSSAASAAAATSAAAAAPAATTDENNVPAPSDDPEWRRKNCPPDVEALGSSTWTLLHTMAAYYPERPAPSQMESMKMFFHGFAQHYPCWFCKASLTLLLIFFPSSSLSYFLSRTISKSRLLQTPFKLAAVRSLANGCAIVITR